MKNKYLAWGAVLIALACVAAAPTYTALILSGSSSGLVTVKPGAAAAGTYNFNLPTAAGSAGQALLSGGGGSTAQTYGTLGVASGGTGLTAGTSGGVLAYTGTGTLASSGALTANLPVIGGGAGAVPSVGSRSGNTTTFGTTTGTLTSGNCVQFDASGNLVDAGAACGTGSGTISSLTGDVTGSGTGAVATTLATVNSNVGTFQGVTVNAKGLVTAASNQSYLTGNQSITLSGDTTGSGTTAITTATTKIGGVSVSLGGAFTTSGSFTTTLTATGNTSVTLPTSGTLATTANINTALPSGTTSQMYMGTGAAGAAGATSMSGDCTLSVGVITCTKTNTVSFATGATTATGTSGATIPLLSGTNVWSGQQSNTVTTLTISTSTFTPTGATNNYSITLSSACPCTIANPSATPVAGTAGQILIVQDGTGSRTVSWGSQYKFAGGTAPTLSTGASKTDIASYFVWDATHIAVSFGGDFR